MELLFAIIEAANKAELIAPSSPIASAPTGMPFGIPRDNVVARNLYRYNPYHRIDIGFNFVLWDRNKRINKKADDGELKYADAYKDYMNKSNKHALKKFRSIWLSLEVFNLMAVGNVASNTWIKDFSNDYRGKWVALQNGNLLFSGKKLNTIPKKIKKMSGVLIKKIV